MYICVYHQYVFLPHVIVFLQSEHIYIYVIMRITDKYLFVKLNTIKPLMLVVQGSCPEAGKGFIVPLNTVLSLLINNIL